MYTDNRNRLFDIMGDGVAIVSAAPENYRNADNEYNFHQEMSFHYLTGLDEPDAIAVLAQKGKRRSVTLFVHPKDPKVELWTGRRLGPREAKRATGVQHCYPLSEFDKRAPALLLGHPMVHMPLGSSFPRASMLLKAIAQYQDVGHKDGAPGGIRDIQALVGEARLVKSVDELDRIRQAIRVTELGVLEAMAVMRPGMREDQIRAVIGLVYGLHGADWAFETIAAGGENGCVLHYAKGADELRDGDLFLLDTGAEVDYYTGDVTRTFPVNGRFTRSQERLYRVVLDGLAAGTAAARPGNRIKDVNDAAAAAITEGLVRMGLLKGRVSTLIKNEKYKKYLPHSSTHWLGKDVHDRGTYWDADGSRKLEAGMVITVEPGIYVPSSNTHAAKQFRGMGIRIEDDILITDKGPTVLTDRIPKDPREIEQAMSARPTFVKRIPAPPRSQ